MAALSTPPSFDLHHHTSISMQCLCERERERELREQGVLDSKGKREWERRENELVINEERDNKVSILGLPTCYNRLYM